MTSKARQLADLLDANGDVSLSALDTFPASYASESAATTAGLNVEGRFYYDTTDSVLKVYDGQKFTAAGDKPSYTNTFDFLRDGSAVSLHRLNNSYNDEGGRFNGTNTSTSFDTSAKFGSHALNAVGNGAYMDIPALPRIYAVSFWAKATGNTTDNGYLVDFRHDNSANGRGYFYTDPNTKRINTASDSTNYNTIGDIYINNSRLDGTYTFPINTWVHVVVSVNAYNTVQTWDQGLRFGNRSDGTTEGLFGHFDQIRTFNRPLNPEDVAKLYTEAEQTV